MKKQMYYIPTGFPRYTTRRYIMKQALEIFLTLTEEEQERVISYLKDLSTGGGTPLAIQEKEPHTSA